MARRQTGGRGRAAVFLVVSLIAAFAATAVIWNLFRGFQEELQKAQEKEELFRVVAANGDLYQGEAIDAEDLVYVELPQAFVPDGSFQDIDEVISRVPLERIIGDELIRVERLAGIDAGVGLNAIIPRGMRAVSVNVTDSSAVAGFLNPGNYVDVLVTIRGVDRSSSTVTLLQATKVLAVDNRLGGVADDDIDVRNYKPSVTLAVTPQDAEKMAHAANEGAVTLTLRNDVDVAKRESSGPTKIVNLIGGEGNAQVVKNVKVTARAKRKAAPKIRKVKTADENPADAGPLIIRGTGGSRGARRNRGR